VRGRLPYHFRSHMRKPKAPLCLGVFGTCRRSNSFGLSKALVSDLTIVFRTFAVGYSESRYRSEKIFTVKLANKRGDPDAVM